MVVKCDQLRIAEITSARDFLILNSGNQLVCEGENVFNEFLIICRILINDFDTCHFKKGVQNTCLLICRDKVVPGVLYHVLQSFDHIGAAGRYFSLPHKLRIAVYDFTKVL